MSSKRDQRFGFTLILFVILLLSILLSFMNKTCDTCDTSETPSPVSSTDIFGNDTIGGCVIADAQLITYEGERSQEGITQFRTQANPPTIIDNSSWDTDLDGWTAVNAVQDSSQGYFMSNGSINMSQSAAGTSQLTKTLTVPMGSEDTFKIVFWVNLSNTLDTGEYLILRITFVGGNSLVYLINGSYTPSSTERKIDVTADLDRTNVWAGIRLAGIEQDYKNQFGVSSVPDLSSIQFQYNAVTIDEQVHIDEFMLMRVPIVSDQGYWMDDDSNKVIYAVVEVQWNVTISSHVNASNVWLQIELEVQIEDPSFNVLAPWDLAQVDLFQVTQFNTTVNWTSRTIELPADDTVYGGDLNYNWTVSAHAYGQIINTTNWVSADGILEGFDVFHITWISSTGEIDVELYAVLGSFGTLGIIGAVRMKKKKKRSAQMFN